MMTHPGPPFKKSCFWFLILKNWKTGKDLFCLTNPILKTVRKKAVPFFRFGDNLIALRKSAAVIVLPVKEDVILYVVTQKEAITAFRRNKLLKYTPDGNPAVDNVENIGTGLINLSRETGAKKDIVIGLFYFPLVTDVDVSNASCR